MKITPGTRVGVLYGGLSAEREVSLKSGKAVGLALQELGYTVTLIDADCEVAEKLKSAQVEVVFNALHGAYGEDGTIQGVLEYLRIPYTGPGVMASSIAMNKVMTKRILLSHNIPTPDYPVLEFLSKVEPHPLKPPPSTPYPVYNFRSSLVGCKSGLRSVPREAAFYRQQWSHLNWNLHLPALQPEDNHPEVRQFHLHSHPARCNLESGYCVKAKFF